MCRGGLARYGGAAWAAMAAPEALMVKTAEVISEAIEAISEAAEAGLVLKVEDHVHVSTLLYLEELSSKERATTAYRPGTGP